MFDLCVVIVSLWLCFGVFELIAFIVSVAKPFRVVLLGSLTFINQSLFRLSGIFTTIFEVGSSIGL